MSEEQLIWNTLYGAIANDYGVAGLMGNLYAESGLKSNNLENSKESQLGYTDTSYTNAVDNGSYSRSQFINDAAGYGLAQWTYSTRKAILYDKVKSWNVSISDIEAQLDHLIYELNTDYADVLAVLRSATSVREASDKVLHDFENPADQSVAVEFYRANLGTSYYNKFAGGLNPDDPTPGGTTSKKKKGFNFVLFGAQRRARRIYG